MILWTIIPTETVLDGIENQPSYKQIIWDGISMEVEMISASECRIARILSTDPECYLDPNLQPGTILTYKPFVQ